VFFFMFFALDPFFLVNLFIATTGYHFQWMLELTFSTQPFEQCGFFDAAESSAAQSEWMASWTIFYWSWWIAWAPFVGIFIAQISRGRTIREFVVGNMMVPTLLTSAWLTVFGGVGLYFELGSIQNGIDCDDPQTEWYSEFDGHPIVKLSCFGNAQDILFETFAMLPLSTAVSVISMIGLTTYFVTSSDSASHVIDVLTAGGITEPPKLQRIFWAFSEGAVASVLLATAGGSGDGSSLIALQTASLVAALPFCVVLLFEAMATYKTLLIHTGELKPEEQVLWTFDLFECAGRCPRVLLALICPPFFQTTARLKIIEKNATRRHDQDAQHGLVRDCHFEADIFKWCWIAAYWMLWALTILFLCWGSVTEGFFQFGCTSYVGYVLLSTANRGMIQGFYRIDSGHWIFDVLSWLFCCCCAAVQEDAQAEHNMDFVDIQLELKTVDGEELSDRNTDSLETEKLSFLMPPSEVVSGSSNDRESNDK